MNLSDNLKRLRKENNLSQEDLAEKLGVSRQSVSKWESGAAYPEMEKLIQISKLFDIGVNELLNDNITEVRENKQGKININKHIDDFLGFITKSIDMFINMTFKQKVKFVLEECFIVLILLIMFSIIEALLSNFISNLLSFLDWRTISIINRLCTSIYSILAMCLGLIVLLHIYKTRYLDYYVIVDKDNIEKNSEVEENNKDLKTELIEDRRQKVIIRDPDNSSYRFITGLIKIFLILVKFNVACILFSGAISLVGFVVALVLSFMIVKSGLFFIGIILSLLAIIFLHLIAIYIMYNFIFDKKSKLRLIFCIFISSLLALGCGIGVTLIGLSEFDIITDKSNTVEKIVPMEEDLIIHELMANKFDYVESGNTDLKIVVNYSQNMEIIIDNDNYSDDNLLEIYAIEDYDNELEFIREIVEDINNKKIKGYNYHEVTIYTTKENIEKLKDNYRKWNESD